MNRCSKDYPLEPPEFSILEKEGITDDQSTEVLDLLLDSARDLSCLKDVYLFSLMVTCQESLRPWNEAAKKAKQVCWSPQFFLQAIE